MSRGAFFVPVKGRCLPPGGLNPIAELKAFLAGWIIDLRGRRDYANLLDGEAALDIANDIAAREAVVGQVAYTAEQADREALALLQRAKLGGLDASDLPLLEQAIRNITHSAEADHQITEGLAI